MKQYLKKFFPLFIFLLLISVLEVKGMEVDDPEKPSASKMAVKDTEKARLEKKRPREGDSSGDGSPSQERVEETASSGSDESPEKKRSKPGESPQQNLSVEDLTQLLVNSKDTQKILPLRVNLSNLPEGERLKAVRELFKEEILDYSIQQSIFPFQIVVTLISWKQRGQEQLLQSVFHQGGASNRLIILSDPQFSCAFSFNNSAQLIGEWVNGEMMQSLNQKSRSGASLFHQYERKEGTPKKPPLLKVTVDKKGQDVLEFFHEIKQDVLGIIGHSQELQDFLQRTAASSGTSFQDVKRGIEERIQLFINQGVEMPDALLKVLRLLNVPRSKTAVESIFAREDREKPYGEIVTQLLLPDDLRLPFYPHPYVDWEQIPELNFRVALMAPHHPVAKYKLSFLLSSWSTMLANQTDGLRKAEEYPNEVNEALKGFLDKKEAVNNLYQRVSDWKVSLKEDLSRSEDPMYKAFKGKRDDSTKAALEAQNTGEFLWVLGKITKDKEQSLSYYRRATELGNPLGFIGMGHKTRDPVEKLGLYFQAVEKGNPYGWQEIGDFFADKSQSEPLVEYFLNKGEPTGPTSSSSGLESLAPIRAALGAVDISVLKADISFLKPYHQVAARACLKAGEHIPVSYDKLATMLEQYRTGWTESTHPVDPKDIEGVQETLYELAYSQGDIWSGRQIKEFRNKGAEMYKELNNFADYLAVTFSDENRVLYEEAFTLFESYLGRLKSLYDTSSAQVIL